MECSFRSNVLRSIARSVLAWGTSDVEAFRTCGNCRASSSRNRWWFVCIVSLFVSQYFCRLISLSLTSIGVECLCHIILSDKVIHISILVSYMSSVFVPFPALCYGDCLEVKKEYYQNWFVLDCVTQWSQSAAHLYEQFLQVKQIGFITLGLLCYAHRSRVVLLYRGGVVLVGFKPDLGN